MELSRATYHLAYIQLTARGLAELVVCGNSLTFETYETALTAAAPVFLAKNGDPFAKQKKTARVEGEQRHRTAPHSWTVSTLPQQPPAGHSQACSISIYEKQLCS